MPYNVGLDNELPGDTKLLPQPVPTSHQWGFVALSFKQFILWIAWNLMPQNLIDES